MDITLNVKPEVLIAKAGELSVEKTTIMSLMDQAKTEITSLTGVFKGEAADEYQGRFRQVYDDIDNMLAIVTEYIDDLNGLGVVYLDAEKKAKAVNEGLPTDGVFKV